MSRARRKDAFQISSIVDFDQYSKQTKRGDIRDSVYWKKKREYIKAVLGYRCVDCGTTLGDLHVDCADGNHESVDIANFAVVCPGCNNRRAAERGEFITKPERSSKRREQVRAAMRRLRANRKRLELRACGLAGPTR